MAQRELDVLLPQACFEPWQQGQSVVVTNPLKIICRKAEFHPYRPAIAALTSLVPTTQILFGTDNPFVPLAETAEGMKERDWIDDRQPTQEGRGLGLRDVGCAQIFPLAFSVSYKLRNRTVFTVLSSAATWLFVKTQMIRPDDGKYAYAAR